MFRFPKAAKVKQAETSRNTTSPEPMREGFRRGFVRHELLLLTAPFGECEEATWSEPRPARAGEWRGIRDGGNSPQRRQIDASVRTSSLAALKGDRS